MAKNQNLIFALIPFILAIVEDNRLFMNIHPVCIHTQSERYKLGFSGDGVMVREQAK